jgi:hypothetical protein
MRVTRVVSARAIRKARLKPHISFNKPSVAFSLDMQEFRFS